MCFLFIFLLLTQTSFATEATKPKIYLGGPDVFFPQPLKIAETKKKIASKYGFEGMFPMDNQIPATDSLLKRGLLVYKSNVELMDKCDFMIANMTPFRGPSMDVGTAFEMGYMAGKGKLVFAYSEDQEKFLDRTIQFLKKIGKSVEKKGESYTDSDGNELENTEMLDNLMLQGTVLLHKVRIGANEVTIENTFEEVLKKHGDKIHKYLKK